MELRRHPTSRCGRCGEALWFGLKEEGKGWKVIYQCESPTCKREITGEYIPMSSVESTAQAYERAEDDTPTW